jgi:hypothetical protein
VAIAADSLWCDVHAFEGLLAADRRVQALDLYKGDLLPSFHVSDVSPDALAVANRTAPSHTAPLPLTRPEFASCGHAEER